MKTRLLIIIGIIAIIGMSAFLLIPNPQQNTCEQMGGAWNRDYCLLTQETWDSGQVTCDPGPEMDYRYCHTKGMKMMIEPSSPVERLLLAKDIEYVSDTLAVSRQITVVEGDPGCGAVVDTDSKTHWFGIDSISNPTKMTLYSENPQQCKVNTISCFCNAQMELKSLVMDELVYFTAAEEEKYSEILIDYLHDENINRTPKFQIGKLNIIYTDSSAIGYCGEIWGTNTYGFFDGAIIDDIVMDYGISKELPLLCAISEDAKWWERK